ncbi:hypothetical protein DNTS_029637 [Danionella cerebrum]|uniref:Uncharacterized protein n=1 Tax=Danionella cerebrum TaxID=2873325 RepID=A0A553QPL0_9TELE|nr:hypothetical protein DNTS_029637 [Danionella translucida]
MKSAAETYVLEASLLWLSSAHLLPASVPKLSLKNLSVSLQLALSYEAGILISSGVSIFTYTPGEASDRLRRRFRSFFVSNAATKAEIKAQNSNHRLHATSPGRATAGTPSISRKKGLLKQLNKLKCHLRSTRGASITPICCEDKNTVLQDCEDDGETAAGGRLLHLLQKMMDLLVEHLRPASRLLTRELHLVETEARRVLSQSGVRFQLRRLIASRGEHSPSCFEPRHESKANNLQIIRRNLLRSLHSSVELRLQSSLSVFLRMKLASRGEEENAAAINRALSLSFKRAEALRCSGSRALSDPLHALQQALAPSTISRGIQMK